MSKVIGIVTEGGPAMIGSQKGLISRLVAVNPALPSFHSKILKFVLCTKLDTMMQLFIREKSSLQQTFQGSTGRTVSNTQ